MTHCGHPESSIETNGTTSYCRDCENEGSFEKWLDSQIRKKSKGFNRGSGFDDPRFVGEYVSIENTASIAREAYTKGRMIERESNKELQHGIDNRQIK